MAQQGQGAVDKTQCKTLKDQLQLVNDAINKYEAQKLSELKSELEAFVKKQQTLVDDYVKTKYQGLRRQWCDQHVTIEGLYKNINCLFPPAARDKIIHECICKDLNDVRCLDETINKRKRCCQGQNERACDIAWKKFSDRKRDLDALTGLSQKIQAELDVHKNLIPQIQTQLNSPAPAVALYAFFFKLLPGHKRLMPDDVTPECKKFADDATPEKLCPPQPCPPEPGSCQPPADEYEPQTDAVSRLPWLLPPGDYSSALDCAWDAYRDAKDAYAEAQKNYKRRPDDLDALGTKLKAWMEGLDAKITDCLNTNAPVDTCCTPADSTNAQQKELAHA